MKPLGLPALSAEQVDAVATLYRSTHHVRLRTRAQTVLLAAEQHLGVREIARMVREGEGTVRGGRTRSTAHGSDGLQDAWAGGAGAPVTVSQCRRPTRTRCCSSCDGGRAVEPCPLPAGRCNGGRTTCWRSRRGSGGRKQRCAARSQRPRLS
jgi:hypothetical protein